MLLFLPNIIFGGSTFTFLKIPTNAEVIGRGEIATSVGGEASLIFWNPAGLHGIRKNNFFLNHHEYLIDVYQEVISYAHDFDSIGSFGFSFCYVYVKGVERRDETGRKIGDVFFDDKLFIISYANEFENLKYGVNLKYASERLDIEFAEAFLMDLGIIYSHNTFNVGFSLKNISVYSDLLSVNDFIPWMVSFGLSRKRIGEKNYLVGFEICKWSDSDLEMKFGLDYFLSRYFTLKGGYRLRGLDENYQLGYLSGFTFGFNLGLRNFKTAMSYIPYDVLGSSLQVSFSVLF